MARILAVGIATIDIINTVSRYPPEDTEVRALSQRIARGGNATNTLVVLSQLGHATAWAGVLVEEPDSGLITRDLEQYRIDYRHCRRLTSGKMPTSYILLSQATGSRSIVHYRDLPEYDMDAFRAIPLVEFDWVHFEGRNVEATTAMLRILRDQCPDLPVSIEIEKARPGIEALLVHADVLLVSRDYLSARGADSVAAGLLQLRHACPQADLVCSLGAAGAVALTRDGQELHSPAYPPATVVDTLGAGDTFNAGIIDARLRGSDWPTSLEHGCRLAGYKCGVEGLAGLTGFSHAD